MSIYINRQQDKDNPDQEDDFNINNIYRLKF